LGWAWAGGVGGGLSAARVLQIYAIARKSLALQGEHQNAMSTHQIAMPRQDRAVNITQTGFLGAA